MATSFVNTDRSVTQAVLWLSSTEVQCYNDLQGDGGGHFGIATQHVGQSHLLDCLAVDIEQLRRGNYNSDGLRAAYCNVEAVFTIQKLEVARYIISARAGVRHQHDWCFAALSFVDSADPLAQQILGETKRDCG